MRLLTLAALVVLSPLLHAQAPPQAITMHVDSAHTEIHWTLTGNMHDVHGTFRLKGGLITFNPSTGAAQGEMLVDLATGESGNRSRDTRMQKDVLESDRYPQAIFHPMKVNGAVKPGSTQNVTVEGTFTIHGADHPFTLPIQVQVNGQTATATTHFSIPYADWGMKNPSTFILRVDKTVNVDVTANGAIEGLR